MTSIGVEAIERRTDYRTVGVLRGRWPLDVRELDVNEQNTRAHDLYVALGFRAEPKPPGRTLFLGMKL